MAEPSRLAVGDVRVGGDGCEYVYRGNDRWDPGQWCLSRDRRGVGEVFPFGADEPLATIDVTSADYVLIFPYRDPLWMRVTRDGRSPIDVRFDYRWIEETEYIGSLRLAAQTAELRAARANAADQLQAARTALAQVRNELAHAADIFHEPPCRWAHDRCV